MNNTPQQISQLRREYLSLPLNEISVADDPIAQFNNWFAQALRAEQPDPEAMTLSTVNSHGGVSARIVLLKNLDERGFVFFTNYNSRKSHELTDNPYAALTFYWFSLNRQIRIEGIAEKVSSQESEDYFQTRPRASQLGAWASPQSEEIDGRHVIDQLFAEAEQRFKDRAVPSPPFWGGFRVKPLRIEFWQGRESRLHDRILYSLSDGVWRISRLAP